MEVIMETLKKATGVWWQILILCLMILVLWAPGAQAAGPLEDVKGLIEEVQAILQTHSDKSQRLQLIEKAADRHLDFREIAQRSLDSSWSNLNSAQQDEFVQVFSQLLKGFYANHLDDFAKTKVDYQGETRKADNSEVRILVIRPNEKIPVNFRLLQEPQGWMIYDMVIDKVSLVENFHNQFSQVIRDRSYAELLRSMKSRLKGEKGG